jgi:hypothetical protein
MNAQLLVTLITIIVAISVVIAFTLGGGSNDANNDGMMDSFTVKGDVSCPDCVWESKYGIESFQAELAVNTIGGIKIYVHAQHELMHFYLEEGVFFATFEPSSVDANGVKYLADDAKRELNGVNYTNTDAGVQWNCQRVPWDTASFEEVVGFDKNGSPAAEGSDSIIATTPYGDITFHFQDGGLASLTIDYTPVEQPVEGNSDSFPVTLYVTEFLATANMNNGDFTFDTSDVMCQNADFTITRALEVEEEAGVDALKEMNEEDNLAARIAIHAEITAADVARQAYLDSFGSDEGADLQVEFDSRNLRTGGGTISHEEAMNQAAMASYETSGDGSSTFQNLLDGIPMLGVPNGLCVVPDKSIADGHLVLYPTSGNQESGYELVARGGYLTHQRPDDDSTYTNEGNNPMHATICKRGSKCVFSWRGSTTIKNWINNFDAFVTETNPGASAGAAVRRHHRGFRKEMMNGINAVNSASSTTHYGKTLGDIWENEMPNDGCTERFYTGHSLGGAAATLGQWYYEKEYVNGQSGKFSSGTGKAVTFAAPQSWLTTVNDNRVTADVPMCSNKRFFIETVQTGNDPVPGIPGLLSDKLFSQLLSDTSCIRRGDCQTAFGNYDHAEYAYVIKHDLFSCRCIGPSFWGACPFFCGPEAFVLDKGCDEYEGKKLSISTLAVWNHLQWFYVTYLRMAVDEGHIQGTAISSL